MARPRKSSSPSAGLSLTTSAPASLMGWAESFGEALGRGMARGINVGMGSGSTEGRTGRRGRPPGSSLSAVSADRRCSVSGCNREARSKGLCSAHYQAERRRKLQSKS